MIHTATFLEFIFIGIALLSIWVRRDFRIWGSFLALSLLAGLIGKTVFWSGLAVTIGWICLWFFYTQKQKLPIQISLFAALVILSFGFKFHLFPGFVPLALSSKFQIGLETPLLGLLPLALVVPLARIANDWKKVLKGLLFGCLGIAILAIVAIASGAIHWHYKLPAFASLRYVSNFVLTAIPEEGFYRGFLQNGLCKYMQSVKGGKIIALVLTSMIFTLAHIFWSPSLAILGFVFLASLLYGGVYLISGKIESAIITHFLLNFIHMTFFSYHAM